MWFGVVYLYGLIICNFIHSLSCFEAGNTNSQLSLVQLAEYLTRRARTESNFEIRNICKSFILVEEERFATQALDPHFGLVQVTFSDHEENSFEGNATSLFSYELDPIEILYSFVFGVMRFSPNCICVLIKGESSTQLSYVIAKLVRQKLARPHNDYFVFIGTQKVLDEFAESQMFGDIRFKYGLAVHSPDFDEGFINFCETDRTKLNLFSRSCPSLLNGQDFHVTATASPSMVRFSTKGSHKAGAGLYFVLFEAVSRKYNFTFTGRYAEFGGASGFKKNGLWHGAVGEVFSREMDFSICAGITIDRHRVVDPSVTLTIIRRAFYMKKPAFKTSWKTIFWPFHIHVWIALVIMLAVIMPIYYLSVKMSTFINNGKVDLSLLGQATITLIQILLEQSFSMKKWAMGLPAKLIVMLWVLFAVILGTGYRANLVSFLTFLEKESIPRTHYELSLSSYQLLFRYYGGVAYSFTASSSDPIHKRIIQKSTLVNTSHDCIISAIMDKDIACLDFDINGEFAIAKNASLHSNHALNQGALVKSLDTDFALIVVWVFRKYSPLVETFDKIILNCQATGLTNYWYNDDVSQTRVAGVNWLNSLSVETSELKKALVSSKEHTDSTGPNSLSFASLWAVFVILGLGVGIGLIMFLGEVLIRVCAKLVPCKRGK